MTLLQDPRPPLPSDSGSLDSLPTRVRDLEVAFGALNAKVSNIQTTLGEAPNAATGARGTGLMGMVADLRQRSLGVYALGAAGGTGGVYLLVELIQIVIRFLQHG